MEVTIYKILEPITGDHWNLKPGCHYEIADQVAAKLLESGSIEPVIETAMQPRPGVSKRVRKNTKRSDHASDSSGGKETPPGDD